MGDTLSGALDDARRLGFVGRAAELAAFGDAVDGRTPARVLFVQGPGGIGKSTLLDEMRRRAVARGTSAQHLLETLKAPDLPRAQPLQINSAYRLQQERSFYSPGPRRLLLVCT